MPSPFPFRFCDVFNYVCDWLFAQWWCIRFCLVILLTVTHTINHAKLYILPSPCIQHSLSKSAFHVSVCHGKQQQLHATDFTSIFTSEEADGRSPLKYIQPNCYTWQCRCCVLKTVQDKAKYLLDARSGACQLCQFVCTHQNLGSLHVVHVSFEQL